MWISPRHTASPAANANLSTVIPKLLNPTAGRLWIIRLLSKTCVVLFLLKSAHYRIINTCGKCAGLITRCKILVISSSVCMVAPEFSAVTCGRNVD